MADPFVGEIRAFGFNYAPVDWMICDGTAVPVNQFPVLYSIIGNQFGGNQSAFNVPNLMGNSPLCMGNGPGLTPRDIGDQVGAASVTLTLSTIPSHDHVVTGRGTSTVTSQTAGPTATSLLSRAFTLLTPPTSTKAYSGVDTVNTAMASQTVAVAGGGQGHENRQPFLSVLMCIALQGEFPPRP